MKSIKEILHHLLLDYLHFCVNISLPKHSMPNRTSVSFNFASLVSAFSHIADARIALHLLVRQLVEHRVLCKLCYLPLVQVLNIRHNVNFTSWLEYVGVIG